MRGSNGPHVDGSWRTIVSTGRNLLDDPAVAGIVVNSRDVTIGRSCRRTPPVATHRGGRTTRRWRGARFQQSADVISGNAPASAGGIALAPVERESSTKIAQAADAQRRSRDSCSPSPPAGAAAAVLDLGAVVDEMWKLLERLVGEAATLERRRGESWVR